MNPTTTIQLGDICRHLEVGERDARYVLERGFIPPGVDEEPNSGTYRQFDPGQAYWLAIVLKLKQGGISTPLAARVAEHTTQALRTLTQQLNWDKGFLPMSGQFDTERQYDVEVGDQQYVRIVTDAQPGQRPYQFPWRHLERPRQPAGDVRPCTVVRLDLTQIAARLGKAFNAARQSETAALRRRR
jgi:hypothetical protein